MVMQSEASSPRVGLLGELEVELRLAIECWHPVRLDTAQMASNADLLAVNRHRRIAIQVKTSDAAKQNTRSQWLQFGYSTAYLKDGDRVFNSKKSPLIADVVIAVNYRAEGSRFVVLPVAFAEKLCRHHCNYWSKVPKRTGEQRSHSFPIYLCFEAKPKAHVPHHARIRRNLLAFENAWNVLTEPIDKLHDLRAWKLKR